MEYTIGHIYEDYKKENEDIGKALFKDICSEFNIHIIEDIKASKSFK